MAILTVVRISIFVDLSIVVGLAFVVGLDLVVGLSFVVGLPLVAVLALVCRSCITRRSCLICRSCLTFFVDDDVVFVDDGDLAHVQPQMGFFVKLGKKGVDRSRKPFFIVVIRIRSIAMALKMVI